jgi:hypothetical protein
VTADSTVAEKGAQAASPMASPRSNASAGLAPPGARLSHSLTDQSALAERKTPACSGFQRTAYTASECAGQLAR